MRWKGPLASSKKLRASKELLTRRFAPLSQKGRGSDFSCWCAANVMSVLLKFVKKSSAFGRCECADKEIRQSFIVDFLPHFFGIGIGDGRLPAAFSRLQF